MIEITLSLANLMLCTMAQLNTWLPITFKRFHSIAVNYAYIIVFPVMVVVTARYVRKYNALPSTQDISNAIYTDDYPTIIKREYLFNFIALLVYQIFIVWIFH